MENYLDLMPLEIKLMIFEFLDLISRIKFIASCKNNRNLMNFCKIDWLVTSSECLEKSPYFDSFTNLKVDHEFAKFPKKLNHLIIDSTFKGRTIFDFPKLTHLEIRSKNVIILKHWNLPSLKNLNIVNCINCIIDECHLPNLTHFYVNSLYYYSLQYCNMPFDAIIYVCYNKKASLKIWQTMDFATQIHFEKHKLLWNNSRFAP